MHGGDDWHLDSLASGERVRAPGGRDAFSDSLLAGLRLVQRREIELIQLVKHLLYTEKYTIEGARQKVDEHRKGGELKSVARTALNMQTLDALEHDLKELVRLLAPDEAP